MRQATRILLGTTEICRNLYDLADGLRRLGYHADTVMGDPTPQHPDLRYEFTVYPRLPNALENTRNPVLKYSWGAIDRAYRLARLLFFRTAYAVYILQSTSWLPGYRDYPILTRLGKGIISLFQGRDIRHGSAPEPVRRAFGLQSYPAFRIRGRPLPWRLTTLRMAERYADAIFAQPSYAELAIRPYRHLYLAFNLSLYDCFIPARDVPVVVHAPNGREVKGTAEILSTLESFRSDGVAFELRLLEGVPNKEVIQQLVAADVVVDELNEASYGMLGLEAMATGCAVAGGNHPGLVPLPPARPVLPINPSNVYTQLRSLLTDKQRRVRLALEGRRFVEKYHSHLVVAQEMVRCVEPDVREHDYYPVFFTRDYIVPNDETITDSLKRITAEIVQRWGLPKDVNAQTMVARGLMSLEGLDPHTPIPRWNSGPS